MLSAISRPRGGRRSGAGRSRTRRRRRGRRARPSTIAARLAQRVGDGAQRGVAGLVAVWSLMSLRLSMSHSSSARSCPVRRASSTATSSASSNARRFARPVRPSLCGELGDAREHLGAPDRRADLPADRVQEARVALAERRLVGGARRPDLAPGLAAERDRHGHAASACRARAAGRASIGGDLGVVERAEVGAAVLEHAAQVAVALELVDLVDGMALLAGGEVADVDERAQDRRGPATSARSRATPRRSRRAPPRRRSR